MEAFLLTLDVFFMIVLANSVRKACKSGKNEDLGWIAFRDVPRK